MRKDRIESMIDKIFRDTGRTVLYVYDSRRVLDRLTRDHSFLAHERGSEDIGDMMAVVGIPYIKTTNNAYFSPKCNNHLMRWQAHFIDAGCCFVVTENSTGKEIWKTRRAARAAQGKKS